MPAINLGLRILTSIFLFIALIVLTTNSGTLGINVSSKVKLRFNDVHSYKYMLFTIIMGIAYSLLQIAFTIYNLIMGKCLLTFNNGLNFDFYGDKVISYILATGTGAGFGASIDLKEAFTGLGANKFFDKGNATCSLLLFAFIFTAISSIFSSLALARKTQF